MTEVSVPRPASISRPVQVGCLSSRASTVTVQLARALAVAAALAPVVMVPVATAQTAATTPAAPYTPSDAAANETKSAAVVPQSKDRIAIELNKVEVLPNGCRTYLVIDNGGDAAYAALKLDLVLFQTDGVIGRRVALDLAPLRAKKRSVKLFDLDGTKCDDIASLLINDVMDCKVTPPGGAAVSDPACLDRIELKTITKVQISK